MTEPVAYVQIKDGKAYSVLRKGTPNDEYTPVYTAEQLRPRVKMTHAEFDEFKRLFEYVDYASMATATIANVRDDFNKLEVMICSGNVDERIKKQNEFNVLWANYNPDNPEETIEIVPDMKWFVRSKTSDEKYGYWYLRKTEHYFFHEYIKELSTQFDTKEEAELWKNPLTEAIKLPVEGE